MIIEPFDQTRHPVVEITDLLHRAYATLLSMGLKFWATHQPPETTLERLLAGSGFVALHEGRIVGTITYYDKGEGTNCDWYQSPGVCRFGQFAVEPGLQKTGIGSALLETVAQLAKSSGKRELALDTSEQADHLIGYYQKKGFRFVQHLQWHGVNYRSVVLSKTL